MLVAACRLFPIHPACSCKPNLRNPCTQDAGAPVFGGAQFASSFHSRDKSPQSNVFVNTENQHPPPALAVVHVPAFLAPAEPCAVVGEPVVLAPGPCNTEKTRQYNSCANTLDGLCAARPRWRGQAAPAALLPPPATMNYLYQISCVCLKTMEGLGEPTATRDAQVERWHGGRRLKFSTTLACSACAHNLQHVLKPGLGI